MQVLPQRKSIRIKDYNYAQAGAYFVTICTWRRVCLLSNVAGDRVELTPTGEAVARVWRWLGEHFAGVALDTWVVMPNHLHGIILLGADTDGDGRLTSRPYQAALTQPLGQLIGAFKTVSTRRVNDLRRTPGAPLWQRNYYEHVITNEDEFNRIRDYIEQNPFYWAEDPENLLLVGARRDAPV